MDESYSSTIEDSSASSRGPFEHGGGLSASASALRSVLGRWLLVSPGTLMLLELHSTPVGQLGTFLHGDLFAYAHRGYRLTLGRIFLCH